MPRGTRDRLCIPPEALGDVVAILRLSARAYPKMKHGPGQKCVKQERIRETHDAHNATVSIAVITCENAGATPGVPMFIARPHP